MATNKTIATCEICYGKYESSERDVAAGKARVCEAQGYPRLLETGDVFSYSVGGSDSCAYFIVSGSSQTKLSREHGFDAQLFGVDSGEGVFASVNFAADRILRIDSRSFAADKVFGYHKGSDAGRFSGLDNRKLSDAEIIDLVRLDEGFKSSYERVVGANKGRYLEKQLRSFDLSEGARGVLRRIGFDGGLGDVVSGVVGDLARRTEEDIRGVGGGDDVFGELRSVLTERGYDFSVTA